jgi:hypothetical protein
MNRAHLIKPHGREADSAGCVARREERRVVVPRERRTTRQQARRVASRMGFGAQARNTSLRALQMTTGIRRSSRLVSEPVRQKRGS